MCGSNYTDRRSRSEPAYDSTYCGEKESVSEGQFRRSLTLKQRLCRRRTVGISSNLTRTGHPNRSELIVRQKSLRFV